MGPQLLVKREPHGSLESEKRAELGDLLRGLRAEGCTLPVATHDENFARARAACILWCA
jgi:ABC-type lipoprotein export system ATPase subunit